MGNFVITIKASGGHGCDRRVKDGEKVYGCQRFDCPDCQARNLVATLRAKGHNVEEATLQHWPNTPQEVQDNLLTGMRKGSF